MPRRGGGCRRCHLLAPLSRCFQGDTDTDASGALQTSTFHFDGNGRVHHVAINDPRSRDVYFVTDAQGQVMSRAVQRGAGDPDTFPWARYLSFDGLQVGEVTNDGPSGQDYAAGMNAAQKTARAQGAAADGNPLFQNGRLTRSADFDQAYRNLAPGSVAGAGQSWTIRDGDTLQSIAAAAWGDASLWYLIADHNGLTSASLLTAGQTLTLPAKVANVGNTSQTFRPYDPNKALGDLNPTQLQPPKQAGKKGCGGVGQIIMVVIAVAVAALVAPYAIAAVANLGAAAGATTITAASVSTALAAGTAGSLVGSTALIAGGAIAAGAASIASQAFGLATGMQDQFDWKQLGLSVISAGVNAGLAQAGIFSGASFASGLARGATASVLTQGVSVATGLQNSFSWTNVAVSAVIQGADSQWGDQIGNWAYDGVGGGKLGAQVAGATRGTASAVVGATARSALTGTSFGDNLRAVLPDVIGSTIGNMVTGRVMARASRSAGPGLQVVEPAQGDTDADAENDREITILGPDGRATRLSINQINPNRIGINPLDYAGAQFDYQVTPEDTYDIRPVTPDPERENYYDPSEIIGSTGFAAFYEGASDPLHGSYMSWEAAVNPRIQNAERTIDPMIATQLNEVVVTGRRIDRPAGWNPQAHTDSYTRRPLETYFGFNQLAPARFEAAPFVPNATSNGYMNLTQEAYDRLPTFRPALTSSQQQANHEWRRTQAFVQSIGTDAGAGAWAYNSGASPERIGGWSGLGQFAMSIGGGRQIGPGRYQPGPARPSQFVNGAGAPLRPRAAELMPYANLADSSFVGPGKNFTAAQKAQIYAQNMQANGGVLRSDLNGEALIMPSRSMRGVTPPNNEAQIDHFLARVPADSHTAPGSNSFGNAQVLSREQNRIKSNR